MGIYLFIYLFIIMTVFDFFLQANVGDIDTCHADKVSNCVGLPQPQCEESYMKHNDSKFYDCEWDSSSCKMDDKECEPGPEMCHANEKDNCTSLPSAECENSFMHNESDNQHYNCEWDQSSCKMDEVCTEPDPETCNANEIDDCNPDTQDECEKSYMHNSQDNQHHNCEWDGKSSKCKMDDDVCNDDGASKGLITVIVSVIAVLAMY